MAQKFPYTPTPRALVQFIGQLRKSFPSELDAGILKKLGLAPNNESYVINVVRFLGLIDEKGKKNAAHQGLFAQSDDRKFAEGLSKIVRDAYKELFRIHGDDAWSLPKPSLSTFFRQSDGTSQVVGDRQVGTFVALAELSEQRDEPDVERTPRANKIKSSTLKVKREKEKPTPNRAKNGGDNSTVNVDRNIGISVRVEVNLPPGGTQETYDAIFRSIKKNLFE